MNFIKGLLGFGERPRHISNFLDYKGEGRLFIYDQGVKKCVFDFGQVTFIQGENDSYERFIDIKNLSKESEFKTDEYAFAIKEEMNMRSYEYKQNQDDIVGFEWENDDNEVMCLEFGTHINVDLVPAMDFRYYICRLIFESKFRETAAEATEEELRPFCKNKEEKEQEEQKEEPKKEQESQGDTESHKLYPQLSGPFTNQSNFLSPAADKTASEILAMNVNSVEKRRQQLHEESKQNSLSFSDFGKVSKENGIPLLEMKTNLYELDINGDPVLVLPQATFIILKADNFRYFLELFDQDMTIVYKRAIKDDLSYHVDERKRSITWADTKLKSQEVSVYVCNITEDWINPLNATMAKCVYEATNQESFEEAFKKPEEQQFVQRWFEKDIEKMEVEEEPVHQSPGDMEISNIYLSCRDKPAAPNTGQVQAKLLDRTFVSQGSVISVFMNNDEDNTFERILSLPAVQTLDGVDFYPKKMMMHEQDTKMLLLSDPVNTKVYYMDIARGKIINEYEGDNVNRFTDIGPTSKHAGLTPNPCFLASNSKNLFLFDPRVSDKNKCVAEKIYATNPKFACITTSDTENMFATGSEKGEIRLYTKMGQNAKTLFPGFGSPILALDSTNDGAWLLATTKTYLMLFRTILEGKNGYKQSISKEAKVPFQLTILPEDLKKYKILELDFKSAKFNDNERDGDRFIVASTGNLLVSWSLKNVIRGNTEKYEIKRIDDHIVSNEFRYKKEEDLLLTLPAEVRVQKAKFY